MYDSLQSELSILLESLDFCIKRFEIKSNFESLDKKDLNRYLIYKSTYKQVRHGKEYLPEICKEALLFFKEHLEKQKFDDPMLDAALEEKIICIGKIISTLN